MDVFDTEKRSQVMASVGSKNTRPELAVRKSLHRAGLRFRLHRKDLPGRPDIVLPSRRLAVFVNGCFWHGHVACPKAKLPKTRTQFWRHKIEQNMARDAKALTQLKEMGWQAIVVWQCDIGPEYLSDLIDSIKRQVPG